MRWGFVGNGFASSGLRGTSDYLSELRGVGAKEQAIDGCFGTQRHLTARSSSECLNRGAAKPSHYTKGHRFKPETNTYTTHNK